MESRSRRSPVIHEPPVAPCAQCGNTLFAPEWSEQLSKTRVRHLWVCHACAYTFETLVCFPEEVREWAA